MMNLLEGFGPVAFHKSLLLIARDLRVSVHMQIWRTLLNFEVPPPSTVDQYIDPGCGEFLRSAVQINLLNGTLSEYFLSGQSNSAVFELKPIEARHISGFSLAIAKRSSSEHQQKR